MNDNADITEKVKKRKPQKRPKQELFVERYAIHHNATLAAIEAGYSAKNAHNTGSRLANNKDLAKRISAYGQLGLDTLAVLTRSNNHIAAEKAAEALLDRAYGKARSNDADNRGKQPNIVISFNKIDTTGKVIESTGTVVSNDVPAVDDSVQATR